MTPLPGWGCPVGGILLLTLAEIEAHANHARPVEHLHVDSYIDSATEATNASVIMSSRAISAAAADDVTMMPWERMIPLVARTAHYHQWNQANDWE